MHPSKKVSRLQARAQEDSHEEVGILIYDLMQKNEGSVFNGLKVSIH